MDMADIAQRFERLEALASSNGSKIDLHISNCDLRNQSVADIRIDHESRLRKLEEFRWKALGAFIAVATLSSFIGSLIANKL